MKEIDIRQLRANPIQMISDDWALVSAGNEQGWNTMTVSWGGIGELWGKDVAFVFIRPQRYTKEFADREGRFTISMFNGACKKEMGFCGKYSGRDCDKSKETGLMPVFAEGTVYIEQAATVLICRTLSVQDIDPEKFLDPSIDKDWYSAKDYHKVYIAEIEKVLEK